MAGKRRGTKENGCHKDSPQKARTVSEISPLIESRRKRQVSKRMQEWIDERQSKRRHVTKGPAVTTSAAASKGAAPKSSALLSPAEVVEDVKEKAVEPQVISEESVVENVSGCHETAADSAGVTADHSSAVSATEPSVPTHSQHDLAQEVGHEVGRPATEAVSTSDLAEESTTDNTGQSASNVIEELYHSSDIGQEEMPHSSQSDVHGFQSVVVYTMPEHDSSVGQSHVLDQSDDQSHSVLHISEKSEPMMQFGDQPQAVEQMTNQAESASSIDDQSELLTHLPDQSQALESLTQGSSHEIEHLSDQSPALHTLNSQSHSIVQISDQSPTLGSLSTQSRLIQEIVSSAQADKRSYIAGTLEHADPHPLAGQVTPAELTADSVAASLGDTQGDVQIMLSSNDSVTQALLESFMADNSSEQEMMKSSEGVRVGGDILPTEHHIAPNIKLTETIQVDENGKKHTVVYLSTGEMDGSERLANRQQQYDTLAKNVGAQDNSSTLEAGKLTKQVVNARISADNNVGESKSQEVVIEVYVGSEDRGQGKKIQNVRVVNPHEIGSSVQGSDSSHLLATSLQTATGLELYSCNKCDYTADKKYNLQKHVKVHHDDRPHLCPLPDCGYSARTFSNLKRHQLTHTDERRYPCPQCDLRFKQKIHLDKHINYIHREKSVKCDFCEYVCANRIPDLKLHMKRRHLKNDVDDPPTYLECEKCGFLAASRKDLKQHFKFHKRGPELKLFCEHCSFVTDAKSRLERHLMIHTKEKPFSCSLCDYRASQKEHIRRHHRTRHKDVAFEMDDDEDDELHIDGINEPPPGTVDTSSVGDRRVSAGSRLSGSEKAMVEEYTMDDGTVESTLDVVTESSSAVLTAVAATAADSTCSTAAVVATSTAATCSGTPSDPSQAVVVTTASVEKKSIKYEPPDYSQRAKSFGCTHCTMRFVRLLSLYKHLHTQHSDLLPHTTEEKLTCVVCEFVAQSHKALLVHMRKHNSHEAGDEDDPGSLYVCVLCKYMNNKRRNLYQHLKKKHKISMMVRKDGTVSCVVEPNAEVTVVSSSPGQQVTEVVKVSAENEVSPMESQKIVNMLGTETNRVVNLLDLANSLTHRHDISHLIEKVNIESGESEQAAAEAIVDLATQNVVIEEEVSSPLSATAVLEADESGAGQIQISEQQLHSLSSGDFIEIDGQTYKVETRGDAITAVLCEQEQAHDATSSYLPKADDAAQPSPYGLSGEVVVTMSDIS